MSLEARVSQVVARVGDAQIAVFNKHAKKYREQKKFGCSKNIGSKKTGNKKKLRLRKQKKSGSKKIGNKKNQEQKICNTDCIDSTQAVLRYGVCNLSCGCARYIRFPPQSSTIHHNISFLTLHHNRLSIICNTYPTEALCSA